MGNALSLQSDRAIVGEIPPMIHKDAYVLTWYHTLVAAGAFITVIVLLGLTGFTLAYLFLHTIGVI